MPCSIPTTPKSTQQRTRLEPSARLIPNPADYISIGVAERGAKRFHGLGPTASTYGPAAPDSNYIVARRDQISARFDGIFSNNVIEHFRDPQRQFEEFRHILKPGGRMAHSSPCYEYAYAVTRFHTLFLVGCSADVLAERTGFRVKHRMKEGEYINVVFEIVDAQQADMS